MRVGLLLSHLRGFNAVDGGLANHFAELAAGLAAAGAAVRVYVVAESVPASVLRSAEGYEIISLAAPMPRWLHRLTGWHWQLNTFAGIWYRSRAAANLVLRDHAARALDVIETSSSGHLSMHLARSSRRPTLVARVSTTAEQLVTHNRSATTWLARRENRAERALVERSDSILSCGRSHRDVFCGAWGLDPARVKIIAHGIALPPVGALAGASEPANQLRVLYVGRFEHRKGIDTLLAALPAVLAAHPQAVATLAGLDRDDYWQAKFWRENPGLDRHRVVFTGPVDALRLNELYQQADVFVAPSRYESFGLIYVEAMAWAKPVIACNAGGIPEVVAEGETGLLIPPGDTPALVQQLSLLLADPVLRQRLGRAGRARAERLFSRSAMATACLAHYATLSVRPAR